MTQAFVKRVVQLPGGYQVRKPDREVPLSGVVPLFKLHGSLNWVLDSSDTVEVTVDLRPALRAGGKSAIVPPLPHKQAPPWAGRIWQAAERYVDADVWVVVGYSLPAYDVALRELFGRASKAVDAVIVHEPRQRWTLGARSRAGRSRTLHHLGSGTGSSAGEQRWGAGVAAIARIVGTLSCRGGSRADHLRASRPGGVGAGPRCQVVGPARQVASSALLPSGTGETR